MSGKLLLPDNRFRSSTAVDDKADMRDENLYSSIVVAHGASGQKKMFTVPQGQAIPVLAGAGIAPTSPHQLSHTELTTNFTKAGESGSAIGDFSIRGIGITFESAYTVVNGENEGSLSGYGMGQQEVNECLAKTFARLIIAGKKQIEGPTWSFPASGSAFGGVATSAENIVASSMSNGWPGALRRLKLPILVARTDTVELVFGVAGSDSLVFSTQAGAGQASLVWCNLHALVAGDVR